MHGITEIPAGLAPPKRLTRVEAAAWRIASHKRACILGSALIPLVLRLALLPWIPPPTPGIQDEFSYLLAGDTYASGRLTNPPHPLWVFFESVHIIQQPTYMSKYPPLMGMILAVGERLFGHPWAGVLLSVSLLCGLLAWALQNWLPPVWALAGTAVAVLKIGILSYWAESYWGGAGAAIGGTLLIGNVPALVRRPRFRNGFFAAVGIALLANSRPFEGLVLTVLCLGYVVWRIIRGSSAPADWLPQIGRGIVAPLLVVMIPIGAWMAYYNFRVTGNALLMPYIVHERQYAVASVFFWQHPRPVPLYRHEALRQAWVDWDLRRKTVQRRYLFLSRLSSLESVEEFYTGIPLTILILACIGSLFRGRRTKTAFVLATLFVAGLCLELEFIPHYAAPATALFYIMAAGALRTAWHWRKRSRLIAYAVILGVGLQITASAFYPEHRFLYYKGDFQSERARCLQFLNHVAGKQLVIVRYGRKHDVNHEWVYNRADIGASQIVWARSMGAKKDQALLSYFRDRKVWLLYENGTAEIFAYRPEMDSQEAARPQ